MRRLAIGILALALPSALTGEALAGQADQTVGTTPAAVVVAACHPSDDVGQRFATFVGQMHALPGMSRMAMRMTLLERLRAPSFAVVALPELKPWRRSKRGASSFIYTQRVTALRDGGTYRMRVQFRWYAADGSVLKTRTLRSGACHQPAPLPNLRVTSISVAPGDIQGTSKYLVTLENDGSGDAGAVELALLVDGGTPATSKVPLLGAGTSTTVEFTAPACATSVRAIADPRNTIRETDETDNALVTACPGGGASRR